MFSVAARSTFFLGAMMDGLASESGEVDAEERWYEVRA